VTGQHLLCSLAELDFGEWRGIPAANDLSRTNLPDCLGPVTSSLRRGFQMGIYNVDCHELRTGGRVDVYAWWGDDRVTFLDVLPAATPNAMHVLAALPTPEANYTYGGVDRETWQIRAPDKAVVEELVWGSRGLAVVTVRAAALSIARVRGFHPMRSDLWIEGFVKFAARPEL
jgi:hypothetical protein